MNGHPEKVCWLTALKMEAGGDFIGCTYALNSPLLKNLKILKELAKLVYEKPRPFTRFPFPHKKPRSVWT